MNELQLIKTFTLIDDFCNRFLPKWKKNLIGNNFVERKDSLKISEIITILILFNSSNILYFKSFYFANYDILLKDREEWLKAVRKELDNLEMQYKTARLSKFSKYSKGSKK
jgi:hypothetical protein